MKKSLFERIFSRQVAGLVESTRDAVLSAIEAGGTGYGFTGEKWAGGLDMRAHTVIDHRALRANGRKVALESTEARLLLNRSTDLVIGTGATLNLEPKYEILGISAETAEKWARNAEMLFDLWASSPRQHRSGQHCFYEEMRLLFRGHKRDNEFFVRLYYSQDPTLILPLQFEIIDPDQIRGDAYTNMTGLIGLTDDGIERDSSGRESAYKIWVQVPGSLRFESVTIPRTGSKSGRLFMLHGFTPEFAGQGRGFSEFGLDIQNFKSITDFKAASLEKAKNQSNIAMTAESSSDNPTIAPPGFGERAGPALPSSFGTVPALAESVGDPSYRRFDGPPLPPGSAVVFDQPGKQKLVPFANTAPVVGQAEYIKGELEPIFASMGTPLEVAFASFKNNYSASQATLILNNLANDVDLFLMAVQCLDPIIEMLFSVAIAIGKMSAPGWQDPILHAAWMAHRWSRPPMPNIDRVQSAKADKMYIEMGAEDLESVAMRLNGSSYRSNVSKLQRQYAELPPPPWGWGGTGAKPDESEKPEKPEGDEDEKDEKDEGEN